MEYKINFDPISISKVLLDTTSEQPIDIDFILPDYCPDIQKILKCSVNPVITVSKLSSSRLDIEGDIKVTVLYIGTTDKGIKHCEYSSPFSHSFNIQNPPDEIIMPVVHTYAQTEYANCRAVSSRKLDIHGAFVLSVEILYKSQQEIPVSIDGDDIEQRFECCNISNITAQVQQPFSVTEILELPKGKPPIETIIRSDFKILLKDTKAIENKLIIKADAFIKIFYISDIEKSLTEAMEYTIPVSQIIDVEGIEEDGEFSIDLEALHYSCDIRSDASGEDSLIDFEARICANIIAFENKDECILADAYSKKYEMNLEYKLYTVEKKLLPINELYTNKALISVTDTPIAEILDVWSEGIKVNTSITDDELIYVGRFSVCILAIGENEEPVYLEKTIDFEHSYSLPSQADLTCKCYPDITSISFRITASGDIELKTDIYLKTILSELHTCRGVSYAFADEDKPITRDNASMVIYYADANEKIWDIARTYGGSVESIMSENNIDEDTLSEKTVLIIPI